MNDWQAWVQLFAAVLGGGALFTFLGKWMTESRLGKKDVSDKNQSHFESLNERYSNFTDRIEKRLAECEERCRNCEAEHMETKLQLREMQVKIALFESAHQDSPLPTWLKDADGTMLSLNSAYEEIFLIPRGMTKADYLHKKDIDVWPEELAARFRQHDLRVQTSGQEWRGMEEVIVGGERVKWRILKYVRYSGGVKLGIAGIAMPPDWSSDQ